MADVGIKMRRSKSSKNKWEAVLVENADSNKTGWEVKKKYRGQFYTIADTWSIPFRVGKSGLLDAQQSAELIARLLNEHEDSHSKERR